MINIHSLRFIAYAKGNLKLSMKKGNNFGDNKFEKRSQNYGA